MPTCGRGALDDGSTQYPRIMERGSKVISISFHCS
jgi:hypothetical protein